jgi:hypothetical protein
MAQAKSKPKGKPKKTGRKGIPQMVDRLVFVEKQLARGCRPAEAIRAAAAEFGVTERQAAKYLAAVYDIWTEEAAEERPNRRARRVRFLEALAKQAFERGDKGDYSAAVAAVREIAKIEGLEAAKKHEFGGAVGVVATAVTQLSDAERMRRIAELEAKRRAALGQSGSEPASKPVKPAAKVKRPAKKVPAKKSKATKGAGKKARK